jgi:hypothetical protein
VNQDEIAVNSTKQVIADLTAQRETIRQAAGATDLPTEYQARTVDLLDLRNRVAAGGPAELKTVLGQKEAELEKLVSHLSDYQAIQQQIDQITQSYSVAATNLALSRTRQDLVSSEPLIENSDSAEISATLTAVRAGLAAAVFFAGIGLLASLMRARKVDSNGELAEEQPPTSRAFGRSSNSVAPYAPKRALRL